MANYNPTLDSKTVVINSEHSSNKMKSTTSSSSSLTVHHQLSNPGEKLKPEAESMAITTAIVVGIMFKRLELASASEIQAIDELLGEKIVSLIPAYLKKYDTVAKIISVEANEERKGMHALWGETSIERFQKFQKIIQDSPLCIVLGNDQCKSSNGLILVAHKVTIKKTDEKMMAIISDKFTALTHRSSQTEYTFIAISQHALGFINQMANPHRNSLNATHSSSQASKNESCSVM